MTLSITHSPEHGASGLHFLPRSFFFPPSDLVCLFLLLSVKSDSTADRPCLAGTCLRPGIFATPYSMSSLLKHQACCINARWQPRLAAVDVCLAWHFSRFPNQTLSHLPAGLLHRGADLFVFFCLSFCQRLSGLRPLVTACESRLQPRPLIWNREVFLFGSVALITWRRWSRLWQHL